MINQRYTSNKSGSKDFHLYKSSSSEEVTAFWDDEDISGVYFSFSLNDLHSSEIHEVKIPNVDELLHQTFKNATPRVETLRNDGNISAEDNGKCPYQDIYEDAYHQLKWRPKKNAKPDENSLTSDLHAQVTDTCLAARTQGEGGHETSESDVHCEAYKEEGDATSLIFGAKFTCESDISESDTDSDTDSQFQVFASCHGDNGDVHCEYNQYVRDRNDRIETYEDTKPGMVNMNILPSSKKPPSTGKRKRPKGKSSTKTAS